MNEDGGGVINVYKIRAGLQTPVICTQKVPNLISCDESRTFWVRFEDIGFIKMGRGAMVGDVELISCADVTNQPYTVNAVSVSTGTTGSGKWSFGVIQGKYFCLDTITNQTKTTKLTLHL